MIKSFEARRLPSAFSRAASAASAKGGEEGEGEGEGKKSRRLLPSASAAAAAAPKGEEGEEGGKRKRCVAWPVVSFLVLVLMFVVFWGG